MDITALEYFKIIAESGSLTKAAHQLHITQPAMSAMLKKLEEELGVELFDRSPNRIHLNKAGEVTLVHVNTILRNVEQLKADVLSAARQSQTLSIAFCDQGVRWFSAPRFSVAHPEVRVNDDLYEGDDAVELLRERKRFFELRIAEKLQRLISLQHDLQPQFGIVAPGVETDLVILVRFEIDPLHDADRLARNDPDAETLLPVGRFPGLHPRGGGVVDPVSAGSLFERGVAECGRGLKRRTGEHRAAGQ